MSTDVSEERIASIFRVTFSQSGLLLDTAKVLGPPSDNPNLESGFFLSLWTHQEAFDW
jgi:hypothetical protein